MSKTGIGILIVLGIGLILISFWIGQLLWNYYAPMFNLPQLSYFQFWGLVILTSFLFKSIPSYRRNGDG